MKKNSFESFDIGIQGWDIYFSYKHWGGEVYPFGFGLSFPNGSLVTFCDPINWYYNRLQALEGDDSFDIGPWVSFLYKRDHDLVFVKILGLEASILF